MSSWVRPMANEGIEQDAVVLGDEAHDLGEDAGAPPTSGSCSRPP